MDKNIEENKKDSKRINKKKILLFTILGISALLVLGLLYIFLFTDSSNMIRFINTGDNDDKENINDLTKNTVEIKNKDLFGEYYVKAEEILSNMTLEEKVGQMCFARCPESGAVEEIKKYKPAGYILFARDFKNENKTSITNKIKSYQNASKVKMLIGVDEEGGSVTRVSKYTQFRNTPFKSPQSLYAQGGIELIKSDTEEKITLLKSLGINVNLAPVADISTNSNDFIYARTLGKDANITANYVKEVTGYYNNKKMGMTLKHFPGYGNNADTHKDFVRDNRSEETFKNSDFLPFKSGIEKGAQSVLVAHNVVNYLDSENPASLSKKWHDLLRKEFKFTGIIMTDDLAMGAIANIYTVPDSSIKAVNAGNDLIITSDLADTVNAIVNGVKNGTVKEEDINLAVKRVIAWKYYLGIM